MSEHDKPESKALVNESLETSDMDEACVTTTVTEYGGPKGPEPTRYGDWERKGRCIDF